MAAMQAVIFDVDGLFLDSEAVYQQSWTEAAAHAGFTLSREMYHSFIGQRIAGCEERLAAAAGAAFDLAGFRSRWRMRWREIASAGVAPKPGALALLAAVRARGVPCAVATSSARPEALLSLGRLFTQFTAVVTGDEVTQGKPDPEIYLLAASRLGIAPGRCIALEDSANGARAALGAGMHLFIVPDLVRPPPEILKQAAGVFASLDEAYPRVLGLLDAG
jgi:HAD superfamily hydrolase (TIGR01509 family)